LQHSWKSAGSDYCLPRANWMDSQSATI
jgi:hypothetical protein